MILGLIVFILCTYYGIKLFSVIISCAEPKPPGWQPPEPESITVGQAVVAALCIPSRTHKPLTAKAVAKPRRVIVARPKPIYVPDWPVGVPVRVEAKGRTK